MNDVDNLGRASLASRDALKSYALEETFVAVRRSASCARYPRIAFDEFNEHGSMKKDSSAQEP